MACVATWSFGIQAVTVASECLRTGGRSIDALEKAVNAVEDDPTTGRYFVGRGCYPNCEGVVQLDAAIMRGRDRKFGAVAALESYSKPISVARRVLERTAVNVLVGHGATSFAAEQGFILESNESLMTAETLDAYKQFQKHKSLPPTTGHDTLSVLCLDRHGDIAAGISTSGPAFKMPGRVGDSPLPGCGLYADNEVIVSASRIACLEKCVCAYYQLLKLHYFVTQHCNKAGAAAATGDGEKIMQFCPSFQIVQLMREGADPQNACETVVKSMSAQLQQWFEVGVIALNTKGQAGAAGTVKDWVDFRDEKVYCGFPFAHWKLGAEPIIYTQPPC